MSSTFGSSSEIYGDVLYATDCWDSVGAPSAFRVLQSCGDTKLRFLCVCCCFIDKMSDPEDREPSEEKVRRVFFVYCIGQYVHNLTKSIHIQGRFIS